MARQKSLSKIEEEIKQVKNELNKAQERYDKLAEKLKGLQQQKYEFEAAQIMEAYSKSGKSYRELMTFLGV